MSRKVLAYRFSSFGDVLMTIPVIQSTLHANPALHLVFVTRKQFAPYFPKHARLQIIAVDLENDYKGISGLLRLFLLLSKETDIEAVLDLHHVLRSRIITVLFRLLGKRGFILKKNRRAKRRFLKGTNKLPLPNTRDLYRAVFIAAGFVSPILSPLPKTGVRENKSFPPEAPLKIGLAPFARHASKRWPLDSFKQLIFILKDQIPVSFLVFGSMDEHLEADLLLEEGVENLCGRLTAQEEIEYIKNLDMMISMDSANMHLADILTIPVVSIWGGTHPDMGYRPLNQGEDDLVSSPLDLSCRPCSVYGRAECPRKSQKFLCLTSVSPEQVAKRILLRLSEKH